MGAINLNAAGGGSGILSAPKLVLLHFDGTNGDTTTTDSGTLALAVTLSGGAALSTTQTKWGATSCRMDGVNDLASIASHADLNVFSGESDAIMGGWFRADAGELAGAASCTLFAHYQDANNYVTLQHDNDGIQGSIRADIRVSGTSNYFTASGNTGPAKMAEGAWVEAYLLKLDGIVMMVIDGVPQAGRAYTATHTITGPVNIGARTSGVDHMACYVDEFIVGKVTRVPLPAIGDLPSTGAFAS